ncbi:unnamed protein product [Gongylonema pulchrum]|uniref:Uncharacterized protein n=1 Tax=Gongylonema pulchrum TaxID=637853 RepID=A0A183EBA7_9BILA|nr:unnamed protein product [Gongylonema pulchrum]
MSLTDSELRNDPRIKKALASQFDAFTNTLMNSAPPQPLSQLTQPFAQQSSAATSAPIVALATSSAAAITPTASQIASATQLAPNASAFGKDETSVPKLSDTRVSFGRDPRKRASGSDHRIITDPRLVSAAANPALDSRFVSPNGVTHASASLVEPRAAVDALYSVSVQQQRANQARDQDHRLQSSAYHESSAVHHVDERISERTVGAEGGRRGWMSQARATIDPRQVKRYGACSYRSEQISAGSSQDRDERELNHVKPETNTSTNTTTTAAPQAPLSLREKRKNNEYESPLSRIPGPTRWT